MSEAVFVDTNVFIASITDEPDRGPVATQLLNDDRTLYTGLLNLMELRTVLTKQKQVEQERVEELIDEVAGRVDVFVHDTGDVLDANRRQRETLLYPMDCLLFTAAEDRDATLVTFDRELIDAGATPPEAVLDGSV